MDFQLTQEQSLILQSMKEFGEEAKEKKDSYQVLQELAGIDFLGIFYPEEYAGAGADFTSYILAMEELAKANASTALLYATQCSLTAYAIWQWGSEELKQHYLPPLLNGQSIGGFAVEEDQAAEAGAVRCLARKEGDSYVIDGRKNYVINAGQGQLYIVFAHTGEDELSAFLVDAQTEGISYGPMYRKMGLDGVSVADLSLKNVRIPGGNLLGQSGQGKEILKSTLELNNIALAAISVGIAQLAMEKSIAYGKERVQFKRPIIQFEALQTMVGNMATNIAAARVLTYQAASLKDQGLEYGQEADIARFFAQKTGQETCMDAIQLHGGYGYSEDLGIEKLLRDIKGISLFHQAETPLCLKIARSAIG
jgi:alkylation response protein AidB-like acyl-CoA dehydrogenase